MREADRRTARDIAGAGFDYSQLTPVTTPHEQVIELLLEALQRLADASEVDTACRIAGRACAVLRRSDAKGERRFNALLHRLTRKLGPVEQVNNCKPSWP
ncbi:hypothetical protein [Bradyrhizobium sp.]|uniref:hypothetical protein n=1 Tax=Bradyrhizobium sp. TaxID=376 RepID=UPI00262F4610|nr:hypothetical protein [Bradyrhizobium sp.]